jgi:hypothetical protein
MGFWRFIKGLFITVFLLSIIVASFWISFSLGRKILSPAQEYKPAPGYEAEEKVPPSMPAVVNDAELNRLAKKMLDESQKSRKGGVIIDGEPVPESEIKTFAE